MRRTRLLNLLATTATNPVNKPEIKAPRVELKDDVAEIFIYDAFDPDPYWGVSAKEFAKALSGISATKINLYLNSPGGDVFEARAIKAQLDRLSAEITVYVDGVAASAATFVMLAGDKIKIARGALIMVHKAWSWAVGNADDMRATAELLDKVDLQIANDYRAKTGADAETVEAWMAAETWFTEDEALAAKLVDEIDERDAVENTFDLSVYDKTPERLKAKAAPKPNLDEEASRARASALRRLELFERT